jgi:hypothetical protein
MSDIPAYTTVDVVKAMLNASNTTAFEDEVTQAVATASRACDKACDRVFYLRDVSNDEVRTYTPKYPIVLEIDDLVAYTSVESDQDGDGSFETIWVLHTDFEFGPDNADLDGRPWERLKVKPWANHTRFPYWNPSSVKVTGRFGWLEVPDGIVSLTNLLAVRLIVRTRMAPLGVAGIGVDGAVRVAKEDPEMAALIRDLSRAPAFV